MTGQGAKGENRHRDQGDISQCVGLRRRLVAKQRHVSLRPTKKRRSSAPLMFRDGGGVNLSDSPNDKRKHLYNTASPKPVYKVT